MRRSPDREFDCQRCGCPVANIDGTWVVLDGETTTADGLTFCPPDPDREPVGEHVPRPRTEVTACEPGNGSTSGSEDETADGW